jgi:ethanolamine ammonia-lyase large subunit/ethanolamine ammonia-lyase small subunit
MPFSVKLKNNFFEFPNLKNLMAKATPLRSGDQLAGLAAGSTQERVAARHILANLPLQLFLDEPLISPEKDEVSRLILESHCESAFQAVKNFSVGQLRDWLLAYSTTPDALTALAPGLTPEMVAAVSKIMGNQDLILVASKCRVVTKFRGTIGLPGRLSTRLQPNHPIDDPRGVAASILDGLLLGSGDAVIGINPATDSPSAFETLTKMLAELIEGYGIPTQSCVLGHITTQIQAIERGLPVDLVFQSIAGSQATNSSFGIDLKMLQDGLDAARSLNRGPLGNNVMYFETGQGSCLSSNAHHGIDQQTLEARAYAVARHFQPLLVNTVVGFIGPEYLYDGKQIIRAGLEDHFCGKLLGLPMGCDVCYTNHAQADQDDMDNLLVLLGAAGCNYIMGVPGADDIMLGYQSTSFHDANFLRQTLGLRPAPEFEAWLEKMGVTDDKGHIRSLEEVASHLALSEHQLSQDLLAPYSDGAQLKERWSQSTSARLALPRAGGSVATEERLDFQLAHADARDAVHWSFDAEKLHEQLAESGVETLLLQSAAPDRETFVQRPDLGRRLSQRSQKELSCWYKARRDAPIDIALVVCDGLSALGVERYAPTLVEGLCRAFKARNWSMGPICVVTNGRVALQDEIGETLKARLALTLIGERPGLGTPDSVSAYLVHLPSVGKTDADRNCVSNIRPGGLPLEVAVEKLAMLVEKSLLLALSGVELKDEDLTTLG